MKRCSFYGIFTMVLVLMPTGEANMHFTSTHKIDRKQVIGNTTNLSQVLRSALEPGDDFEALQKPGPHDWLANHPEPGQTYQQFIDSNPNRPDAIRKKITIQPLGEIEAGEGPPLSRLKQFAEAFFAMEVEILPSVELRGSNITTRKNPYTSQMQLLTVDILKLLKKRLPDDAFCLLGITMFDLYPEPSWNFVFGQASLRDRVAVYSFARYNPEFHGEKVADPGRLTLERSCKVLAHETAHMFGIQHCVFFQCLMNGSNHLAESDSRPLHLCPVDLRKLHESVQFDNLDRYHRLLDFSREVGFVKEAKWLEKRIKHITTR